MLDDDTRDMLNERAPDERETPRHDDTSERITRMVTGALVLASLVSLALNIYDANT